MKRCCPAAGPRQQGLRNLSPLQTVERVRYVRSAARGGIRQGVARGEWNVSRVGSIGSGALTGARCLAAAGRALIERVRNRRVSGSRGARGQGFGQGEIIGCDRMPAGDREVVTSSES